MIINLALVLETIQQKIQAENMRPLLHMIYNMLNLCLCLYSLVKMVYGFAVQVEQGDQISDIELEQCIRRNFSGLDDLDPVKIFSRQFPRLKDCLKVMK
jgi:hypothetical protein